MDTDKRKEGLVSYKVYVSRRKAYQKQTFKSCLNFYYYLNILQIFKLFY